MRVRCSHPPVCARRRRTRTRRAGRPGEARGRRCAPHAGASAPPGLADEPRPNGGAAPPVWAALRNEAHHIARVEPSLASIVNAVILRHDHLSDALSYQLARKLGDQELRAMSLREIADKTIDTKLVHEEIIVNFQKKSGFDPSDTIEEENHGSYTINNRGDIEDNFAAEQQQFTEAAGQGMSFVEENIEVED